MNCCFTKLSSQQWYCPRCKHTTKVASKKAPHRSCLPGLGDKIALGLSLIKITKKSIRRLKALFGYKKANCGCSQRQEALNDLGRRVGL